MKRIMIACITFDTVKIANPVKYYKSDKVYLIHYDRDKTSESIYTQFYEQTKKLILEYSKDIEIIECNKMVFNFTEMLKTVLDIIDKEKGNEIAINISAGAAEYTAAATIAAMMSENTIPFTVNAPKGGYNIPDEKLKKVYFSEDGKTPIGEMKLTKDPEPISTFTIDRYDAHLIKGLKIFYDVENGIVEGKVIDRLISDPVLWKNVRHRKDTTPEAINRINSIYYRRYFLDRWLEHKWVEEKTVGFKKSFVLTDKGLRALETFYFFDGEDWLNVKPGTKRFEKEDEKPKKGEEEIS